MVVELFQILLSVVPATWPGQVVPFVVAAFVVKSIWPGWPGEVVPFVVAAFVVPAIWPGEVVPFAVAAFVVQTISPWQVAPLVVASFSVAKATSPSQVVPLGAVCSWPQERVVVGVDAFQFPPTTHPRRHLLRYLYQ